MTRPSHLQTLLPTLVIASLALTPACGGQAPVDPIDPLADAIRIPMRIFHGKDCYKESMPKQSGPLVLPDAAALDTFCGDTEKLAPYAKLPTIDFHREVGLYVGGHLKGLYTLTFYRAWQLPKETVIQLTTHVVEGRDVMAYHNTAAIPKPTTPIRFVKLPVGQP